MKNQLVRFLTLFLFSFATFASVGELFYTKGKVIIISKDKKKRKGKKGSALFLKDRIKVGQDGLALIKLTGSKGTSRLKVNENSELQIKNISGVKRSKKTSVF